MKNLYIWGTGNDAKILLKNNILFYPFIAGFIHSSPQKLDNEIFNKDTYFPSEINWEPDLNYVIIATRKYYSEIEEFLKSKGYQTGRDYTGFYCAWHTWCGVLSNKAVLNRIMLFERSMNNYKCWIPGVEEKVKDNGEPFLEYISKGAITSNMAVLLCCAETDKNIIALDGASFEYDNLNDFSVIIDELLINEDYYFEADTEEPLIIDAGANVGLAIYYFKHLYPKANIIAFEPSPKIFNIVQRNIIRNSNFAHE